MSALSDMLEIGLDVQLARFGETITYVPSGGDERSITALVTRGARGLAAPMNANAGPSLTITVANDATKGISSDELNLGKDNIKVPLRPGLTAESRPLGKPLRVTDVVMIFELI